MMHEKRYSKKHVALHYTRVLRVPGYWLIDPRHTFEFP